jgi:hypothetical protein
MKFSPSPNFPANSEAHNIMLPCAFDSIKTISYTCRNCSFFSKEQIIPPHTMAGASSRAAVVAAVAGSPSGPKNSNSKWNDEAHRALIGTLLDVLDSADAKWRAHLDLMVESMEERGQQFSKEGIR